jgi:hypothetical protein
MARCPGLATSTGGLAITRHLAITGHLMAINSQVMVAGQAGTPSPAATGQTIGTSSAAAGRTTVVTFPRPNTGLGLIMSRRLSSRPGLGVIRGSATGPRTPTSPALRIGTAAGLASVHRLDTGLSLVTVLGLDPVVPVLATGRGPNPGVTARATDSLVRVTTAGSTVRTVLLDRVADTGQIAVTARNPEAGRTDTGPPVMDTAGWQSRLVTGTTATSTTAAATAPPATALTSTGLTGTGLTSMALTGTVPASTVPASTVAMGIVRRTGMNTSRLANTRPMATGLVADMTSVPDSGRQADIGRTRDTRARAGLRQMGGCQRDGAGQTPPIGWLRAGMAEVGTARSADTRISEAPPARGARDLGQLLSR